MDGWMDEASFQKSPSECILTFSGGHAMVGKDANLIVVADKIASTRTNEKKRSKIKARTASFLYNIT